MEWTSDNELEIVEKAKKDIRYFDILYRKYFPMINNFVYRRLEDEDLKNEIVANVFYKVMNKLYMFKVLHSRKTSFSAWVYRIAINEINQYYRNQKREKKIYNAEKQNFVYNMQDKEPLLNITFEDVKAKFEYLKPKDRDIISLRFFEKLSYQEISEILKINEGTAKVRLHRALKKLKSLLEKE